MQSVQVEEHTPCIYCGKPDVWFRYIWKENGLFITQTVSLDCISGNYIVALLQTVQKKFNEVDRNGIC